MIPTTSETSEQLKARGAFYTPSSLTSFMARWAIRSHADTVIEPSCGDGAFITAIVTRLRELGGDESTLVGVERDSNESTKAKALAPLADIRTIDFFDLDTEGMPPVDVAIGNPPYIRYQDFAGAGRIKAVARARDQDVWLNGLASSWAHFVVHMTAFLKPKGRLALVLPAELLHADYAQPVRAYLLRRFGSLTIVAFDRMVFSDAQVDAVLLLADPEGTPGLRVVRVKDGQALGDLDLSLGRLNTTPPEFKWTRAIDQEAAGLYGSELASGRTVRLGELARVDIGFVSGADSFFILSDAEAESAGLPRQVLTRAIRRPRDVPGLAALESEESNLLDLGGQEQLDESTRRYLASGVENNVDKRYKTRMRKQWYAVPLPRNRPHALIPYMSHQGPRLIITRPGTRNSNLLHGVTFFTSILSREAVAVAMCSSLTLLSAEIEGRAYGGGVLKVETKEAERLRIPSFEPRTATTLEEAFTAADRLVRIGDVKGASILADEILAVPHEAIWGAYMTFRTRRLGRRAEPRHDEKRLPLLPVTIQ